MVQMVKVSCRLGLSGCGWPNFSAQRLIWRYHLNLLQPSLTLVTIPGMSNVFLRIGLLLSFFTIHGVRVAASGATDGSCGPPHYCARTDRKVERYPKAPLAPGPAGSIVVDPRFGSRILRVTDAKADPMGKGRSFK